MYPDLFQFLRDVWQNKPAIVVLFVGGLILFILLVVDTFRHRKQRKARHRIKRHN